MAYTLTYKYLTGKTGLYIIIQDYLASKYWDDTNNAWVTAITDDCKISLSEGTGTSKGIYTGSAASLDPVRGGVYQLILLDSNDTDLAVATFETYSPKTETVLEIVNYVQKKMRFPVSSAVTDAFSLAIIEEINRLLTDELPNNNIIEYLKVKGSFSLKKYRSLYTINPINAVGVDLIHFLRKPNLQNLQKLDDLPFREIQDSYNQSLTYTNPLYYRIASSDGNFPIVEVTCAPDKAYIISYEVITSPKKISAATDYVPLSKLVKIGALLGMKMAYGQDTRKEQREYSIALENANSFESNTFLGDVEV